LLLFKELCGLNPGQIEKLSVALQNLKLSHIVGNPEDDETAFQKKITSIIQINF
jgi:hypothetical protein